MTQEWLERPVFLTGLMKSGTTLLLGLMDGADGVLCYPDEPSFDRLWSRTYDDAEHMLRDWIYGTPNPLHLHSVTREAAGPGFDPRRSALPKGAYPRLSEVDAHASRSVLRGLEPGASGALLDRRRYLELLAAPAEGGLSRIELVRRTVGALRDALPNPPRELRAWAFKQPMPAVDRVFLDWFWTQFPAGRTVFIVRDPRAYYVSRIDYTRRGGLLGHLRAWRRRLLILASVESDYRQIVEIARQSDPRLCLVRYEDLVTEPEATMQRVAAFTGVPFTEALSRPTKLGTEARMPTATRSGGNTVFQSSKDRWRDRLGTMETALVESLTWRALEHFGYGRKSRAWQRACMAPVKTALAWVNRVRRKPVRLGMDPARGHERLS